MEKIIINKKISTQDNDYFLIKFKEYSEVDFVDIKINLDYFRVESNIVVICFPWNWWTSNWYNDKYHKMAKMLWENNFANMICLDNKTPMWLSNKLIWLLKLQTAIEEVLNNPLKFSNSENPEIYLIWYSDWWSIVAWISYFYKEIKKILLISPSLLIWKDNLEKSLSNFKWKAYIIVWEDDEIIWKDTWKIFYNYLKTKKKILFLPKCDHNFKWEYNNNIFIKAPIYAFKDWDKIKFDKILF